MRSNRLTLARHLFLALLAVLMFSAVAATAAEAEEAPFWTVEKCTGCNETRRLGEGQTRFITAKTYEKESFVLTAGAVKIACEEVAVLRGAVLLGSAPGNEGTNDEVVTFTKCNVKGNGEPCTVEEPINTVNLKSELVESIVNGKPSSLLVLFEPETGARFVTLKFTGTGCKAKAAAVEGSVLASVLTDPEGGSEKPRLVELGGPITVAKSWLLKITNPQPTEVWLVHGGTHTIIKPKPLLFASVEATLTGTALILLATINSSGELVSTGEGWSPLA